MIINKLQYLIPFATPRDSAKLSGLVKNWETVLSNYHSHNSDLTPMLNAEAQQFIQVVNHFKAYQSGQMNVQDFLSAVENTLDGVLDFPVISVITYALNGVFYQLSQSCDQVLPYGGATEDYGGADSYLQGICNDFDPNAWRSFYSMVNGACSGVSADGEPNNPLSSSPLFQKLCLSETLEGDAIPGGVQSSNGPETLLGFLNDNKKYITYGADSPVELSWTSTVTESKAFVVEFDYSRTLSVDLIFDFNFEAFGIGLETKNDYGLTNVFNIQLGKSSEEEHEEERTVTVSFGDNDNGDFFAVKITEDSVYGTPVFTTMGGASKCPGETGTSRRESNVKILEIRERCGLDNASPCNELTLNNGDYANFGAVIENLSPTQDEVYYTIKLTSFFDDYQESGGDGNYTCGVPGQLSGLLVTFQQSDLQRIPYNRPVEVLFSVTNNQNGAVAVCNEFNSIGIEIIATCEMPSPNSFVYQYGVFYNETTKQTVVLYDSAHRIYASNSTATFDVKWPPAARRLSEFNTPGVSQMDGSSAADAIVDVLLREIRETKASLEEKVATLNGVLLMAFMIAILTLLWVLRNQGLKKV